MRFALPLLLAALAAPAYGQDAYRDDRSTPQALVKSLYNAINRGEYSRAYSYFAQAPAATVEDYAQGYANTESVELIVGTPHEEAAAGSVYYELPVAIRSVTREGDGQVFRGCYILRMADPANTDDFEPLHIERGSLRPADEPLELETALPVRCTEDGAELPAYDPALTRAKALYAEIRQDVCPDFGGAFGETAEPESHTIAFNYSFDREDEPERTVRLFRFFCSRGAYNEGHLYFMVDDTGEVQPLHFAVPELDVRYADGEGEEVVEAINVIGFSSKAQLVNSDYDPATRTLSDFSKWRGLGDAFSAGRWMFRDGRFALVHYVVDAAYDGENDPETLIDYETAP